MHRSCRWLLLAMLLLLTACSSTSFFYNRLHFLVPWYLGGYVDLERPQRQYLDELLASYLQQHRQEELPRYVAILDQAVVLLDSQVVADDIGALYTQAEQAAERLQAGSLEWMLALGAELSDQQVQVFLQELQTRQQEYAEKYLSRDDKEFHQDVYKSLRKNSSKYLGRLDAGQRKNLEQASRQLKRSDALWLQDRQVWIDYLRQILQRQPGWQDQLRQAFAMRGENASEDYNEVNDYNLRVIQQALAELLNSRSEKQDRRLRVEIAKLRGELLKLIEQG